MIIGLRQTDLIYSEWPFLYSFLHSTAFSGVFTARSDTLHIFVQRNFIATLVTFLIAGKTLAK